MLYLLATIQLYISREKALRDAPLKELGDQGLKNHVFYSALYAGARRVMGVHVKRGVIPGIPGRLLSAAGALPVRTTRKTVAKRPGSPVVPTGPSYNSAFCSALL
jgi:hypothetical protein